jgi:hypothetical protein
MAKGANLIYRHLKILMSVSVVTASKPKLYLNGSGISKLLAKRVEIPH